MGIIDFLTIILLAVAIITLVFMGWETSLTRKQMRGEVYRTARVKDLYFLLPATRQREVKGFRQEDKEERPLGEYIAIPVGLERELHICWEMAETQNLRGYRIRFEGNPGSKPEILGMERAFRKKILQTYGSEEFIDWNGDFHREYARQFRCPKGSYHYVALRVRGMVEGKYSMHVRVRVDEAQKPFEGKLTVDCLTKPNDWAEQHWVEEHIT
jgi:hypothetical protein